MPQDMTRLPQTTYFRILGAGMTIRNHKIIHRNGGLITWMMDLINDPSSNRDILTEFEKHGISFEAAVEQCVRELEDCAEPLAHCFARYPPFKRIKILKGAARMYTFIEFQKSMSGRKIAESFVDKIRSCEN